MSFHTAPPAKRQRMSLSQTYYVAHTARAKLSREASRPDYDLRVLVGHANLLDNLMIDLADAERSHSVEVKATTPQTQKVSWAPQLPSPVEAEEEEMDYDSESDSDEEMTDDEEAAFSPVSASSSNSSVASMPEQQQEKVTVSIQPVDDGEETESDEEEDEEYEDDESETMELQLVRTASRQHNAMVVDSTPVLTRRQQPAAIHHEEEDCMDCPDLDSELSSDEEETPLTPPGVTSTDDISVDEDEASQLRMKQVKRRGERKSPQTTAFYEQGFFLPARA